MNGTILFATAFVFLACLAGCKTVEPASDEHLRERVEGFCADWREYRFERAYEYCSHNFRSSMDATLFAYFMKKMPIRDYGAIEISQELAVRNVSVEIKRLGGSVLTIEMWWRYERGEWFVDLIEWR